MMTEAEYRDTYLSIYVCFFGYIQVSMIYCLLPSLYCIVWSIASENT